MPTFTVKLKNFDFPEDLDDKKANFRFIIDVRYVTVGGDFVVEHVVMPSLDTFWECDKGRSDKPNYVRDRDTSCFDMDQIDAWDHLAIRLTCKKVDSMQVKVIDVDRVDVFDKLKEAMQGVLQVAIGTLRTRIASSNPIGVDLPASTRQSLGSAADDVEALVLKKLAGGNDVLFRGSAIPEHNTVTITGKGTKGTYTIAFEVVAEKQTA